jgi:hypothetical protein
MQAKLDFYNIVLRGTCNLSENQIELAPDDVVRLSYESPLLDRNLSDT